MEHADPTGAVVRGGVDGPGVLRRLRQNHSADGWGRTLARQALGADGPRIVHRVLSVAHAFDQQIDHRDYGAILQISRPYRRGFCWRWTDRGNDCRLLERGQPD